MTGILRTDAGEIRYIWKISLSLILVLVLIVISRLVLILVTQQVFILQGMISDDAFQNAQVFVSESPEGQAIASLLDLVLVFLLVFILITRIENREFTLVGLGLNIRRNTLPFVGLGLLVGCVLFFGSAILGLFLGAIELPLTPNLSQWALLSTIFASVIFYILNSFWQELLFRGYLQTRAVDEYGRYIGVVAVSVVFVVFHGLVQTLTPIGILTGILLFLFIGLLYDKTKSIYLVVAIHFVLNFLPVLYDIWWQGLEIALVYGIALILLILVIRQAELRNQIDNDATLS